jgi:hypothetical protein
MTSTLIAAAAAIAGAGTFTALSPAYAAPGDCQQWVFPGFANVDLTQATGEVLGFGGSGDLPQTRSSATWEHPNGHTRKGDVLATILPDGHMNVLFFQDGKSSVELIGDVGADGIAKGFRPGAGGESVLWTSTPMACIQKAEAGSNTDPNSREVTGDVDVYDVPGGVGTVIGMLDGGEGQRVQLGSGCRDDSWCNIAWEGGTAWVWGDFLKQPS